MNKQQHGCLAAVMTGGEVAAEFGVDGSTVRRACANGWIPARKADARTWLIRRSDAERRWGRPSDTHTAWVRIRQIRPLAP